MNIVITDGTIEIDGEPYKKGSIRPVQVGDNISLMFPYYNNQSIWSGKWQDITFAGVPCESAAAFKTFQQANFYAAVPGGMAVGEPVAGGAASSLLGTDADGNLTTYSSWKPEVITYTALDSGVVAPLRNLIILVDATDDNVSISIPPAADAFDPVTRRSIKYHVKRIDNSPNSVNILGIGSPIDDDPNGLVLVYLGKGQIISDGTKWWTV